MTELIEAKRKLHEKLGGNFMTYTQLLNCWFRGSLSKEQFDIKTKQMFSHDIVPDHNKFWLALFRHCTQMCANSAFYDGAFNITIQPRSATALNTAYLPTAVKSSRHPKVKDQKVSLCCREKCLPSKLMTLMRLNVTAWEMGLDSVSDGAVQLLSTALYYFLKNIITAMLSSKSAFRLRENRFKYALNVKNLNPYSETSSRFDLLDIECDPYQIEAKMNSSLVDAHIHNDCLFPHRITANQALFDQSSSFSCQTYKRRRLMGTQNTVEDPMTGELVEISGAHVAKQNLDHTSNLFHLFIALSTDRSVISNHPVYIMNLERIIARLNN